MTDPVAPEPMTEDYRAKAAEDRGNWMHYEAERWLEANGGLEGDADEECPLEGADEDDY